MRSGLSMLCILALVACAQTDATTSAGDGSVALPETTLPIFGDGYPEKGDICRRVGESEATINFLDDSADLIACPEAWQERESYAASVMAREVMQQDGYVLYSVPRGI